MKIAVVYYSFSGNTDFAVGEIAKILSADKFRIETQKSGFGSMFSQMFLKKLPQICEFDKEFKPDAYEKIVLAAPVWAWDVAPAMKAFLKKCPLQNKEIALLMCSGAGNTKTLAKWKKQLDASNKIVGEKEMKEPMKFHPERSLSVVENWARESFGIAQ